MGTREQQAASGVQQGRVDRGHAGNNGNDKTRDRGVSGTSVGTEQWVLKHPTTALIDGVKFDVLHQQKPDKWQI